MLSPRVLRNPSPGPRRLRAYLATPLIRNAYYLILSSTVTSALGLPFWVLAARKYPAADVGRASATVSALLLISGVAQLGLPTVLPRYLPGAARHTLRLVLRTYGGTVALSLVLGVIAAATSAVWSPPLGFLGDDAAWFALFVALAAAMTISNLQDSVMTGLRQARWVPVENAAFSTAKIAAVVALASSQPHKGIVLAWLLPQLAVLVPVNLAIFARFIPRHVSASEGAPLAWEGGQLRRVLLGNFAGGLSSLVITFLMPILVVNIKGAREGAYFFVPWTVSTALRLIAQNMATSMTVEAGFDEAQWRTHLRRAAIGIFRLLVPTVAVLLVLAHPLLSVFGAEYARAGTGALRLLALGTLPHAVSMLGLGLARIRHNGRFIAVVQTTDAATMLVLSAILIPSMGFAGAGVAWLVAQTVAAVMSTTALVRALRSPQVA
jgi:O-antigen/teichoic acid export membrane protein